MNRLSRRNCMLQGEYLALEPTSYGLTVRLTDAGKLALLNLPPDDPEYVRFAELFDDFAANGWNMLAAFELGALTGCEIIISPDAQRDDCGNLESVDTVFWHERYQIEDAVAELQSKYGLWLMRA